MPLRLIIAGPPASGKGTQCEHIRDTYGVVHISTGDLLREQVRGRTPLGIEAQKYMDAGQLVPDEIVIGMVSQRLSQDDVKQRGWLLDGFPRTNIQANAMDMEGITPDLFLLLEVPDSVLVRRACGRRLDPETGTIYHLDFNPPPTAEIAARLLHRSDDTEEKVRERLRYYHTNIQLIKAHYEARVAPLDGAGKSDQVWKLVKTTIDEFIAGERDHLINITERLQEIRKDLNVPDLFKTATGFKHEPSRQHPLYQTTGSDYGARPVQLQNLPFHWHGRKGDFSRTFQGGTYRNQSLNTSVSKSRVLNDQFL